VGVSSQGVFLSKKDIMNKIFALSIAIVLGCFLFSAQADEKSLPIISERYIPEFYKITEISDVVGKNGKAERHLIVRGTKHFVLGEMAKTDKRLVSNRIVKLYFMHREVGKPQPYLCTHGEDNNLCYLVLRMFDDSAK
jgi:hypothetical protein